MKLRSGNKAFMKAWARAGRLWFALSVGVLASSRLNGTRGTFGGGCQGCMDGCYIKSHARVVETLQSI